MNPYVDRCSARAMIGGVCPFESASMLPSVGASLLLAFQMGNAKTSSSEAAKPSSPAAVGDACARERAQRGTDRFSDKAVRTAKGH